MTNKDSSFLWCRKALILALGGQECLYGLIRGKRTRVSEALHPNEGQGVDERLG